MSELTTRFINDTYAEYYNTGKHELAQIYLKSEADKVIAELNDKLRAANEQIENLINSASNIMLFQDKVNNDKCAELRHHKYKRCLAMAMWCWAVKELNRYGDQDYMDFAEKWRKRWLELAEKFKEAK